MFKRKKSLLLLTFLGLFFVTSCDISEFGEDITDSVIESLIPNFWAFLVQFLALLVLILLVFVFAYKPLKKFMDKRADFIYNEVNEAKENNVQSQKNLEESIKEIANSKKQGSLIIDEAKKDALIEKDKIIEDANKEALRIKKNTEEEIKEAKEKAKKEIHDEIINVALDASSHILDREINEDDDKKIIDNFIDDLKD